MCKSITTLIVFIFMAIHACAQLRGDATISAGGVHSLALKEDGTVVAWGDNEFNQCDVPNGLKAVSVSAGGHHSLALKEDGTVVAWGNNDFNQCDVPNGLKAVSVSAGKSHSLALKEDGTVVAWGYNGNNQCDVPNGLKAVSVSAGRFHRLALKEDGTVVAWGYNDNIDNVFNILKRSGYLGTKDQLITQLADPGLFQHAFNVLRKNGFKGDEEDLIYLIGIHPKKKDQVLSSEYVYNQCDVPNGLKAVSVSAGHLHSLALKEDGTVVAWGNNDFNQCDVPDEVFATENVQIDRAPPLLEIQAGSIAISGATVISGMDSKRISFDLVNRSGGLATGLTARIELEGDTRGITIPSVLDLPSLAVGNSAHCELPMSTDRTTVDGLVRIRIEVVEPNGFSPKPFTLELPTKAYRAPRIEVVDFSSTTIPWQPLTPISLDVLVQNTGKGDAKEVEVQLVLPASIACISENQTVQIGDLPKGEMMAIKYDLLIARSFEQSEVVPLIELSEVYGDYGSQWMQKFPFINESDDSVIRFSADQDDAAEEEVKKASFSTNTAGGGRVTFRETNANHTVKTVAVVAKEGSNCAGDQVNGDELAAFTENQLLGTYNIVDRKFIDQTLGEIKFTMSGMTKEDQILEAGCMQAAEGYVFVEYGCFEGSETVNIKMIHCESGENMWISQGIGTSAAETVSAIVEGLTN